MAKFEVDGKTFYTENLSDEQKYLLNSLSITSDLMAEVNFKNKLFLDAKKNLEKSWVSEFGSRIKNFSEKATDIKITLANGKKLELSKLSHAAANLFKNLNFLSEQINYYQNQIQVLDTAKITYSKSFYAIIKGAE